MSFVRNVVDDLVEKRLWPVALVLVVLLVAVPVVLGSGGGGEAAEAPPAIPAATDDGPLGPGGSAITAQTDTTARQDRGGRVRDPFKTLYAAKGKAAAAADEVADVTDAAAKAAAGATSGTPAAADDEATTPSTPDTSKDTPAPADGDKGDEPAKPDPQDTYRVSFDFGEIGELKRRSNVARLTPFPSENRPYVIYLGLLSDRKTAVFLLSSDVTADGEGTCRPTKANCETVELRAGDSEVLDVAVSDTKTVQYELVLKAVKAGTASTKAVAAKAHARQSKVGRKIVQTARLIARVAQKVTNANAYAYDAKLGVLHREDPEEALGAHLPQAVAP